MLIAFTGAGISAASGVPTFQTQPGIRDKLTRSFANRHPDKYNQVIQEMLEGCQKAEPNDAHKALAEYDIPIITMNVDELHQRAGSEHVLPIHGSLTGGDIVLYGDPAPLYEEAYTWVGLMREGDILLIVGTSYYTSVSCQIKKLALMHGVDVIEIQDHAEERVRQELEAHKDCIGDFQAFFSREDAGDTAPIRPPYSGGWDMS